MIVTSAFSSTCTERGRLRGQASQWRRPKNQGSLVEQCHWRGDAEILVVGVGSRPRCRGLGGSERRHIGATVLEGGHSVLNGYIRIREGEIGGHRRRWCCDFTNTREKFDCSKRLFRGVVVEYTGLDGAQLSASSALYLKPDTRTAIRCEWHTKKYGDRSLGFGRRV